ncbi:peptidoglycan-binding domain-containing protein, partial [Stenotrophomonas maltophilia]|uniref:peptidoglycan-binding domain-containing protein n=1 Tax=Stenotrophomonas maltophilia TaxID=40324 RepID=UPI001952E948
MAGEENDKKEEGKGFAGLSSLVSDVDTTPPPAAKKEPAAAAPSATHPAPQPAQPQPQPQPQPSQRQTYQEPPQPSSGSSGGKWVLGIAAVIGVFWLIGQADKPTTSSAPSYSPPTQSAAPSYTPPPQPQAPSQPVETKPPVGQDLVLSREQIRYCLAEDIRLDATKSAVNNYVDADVDRFNAMVADYNSRCSSFRYHTNNRGRNDLNSAQRDIEPYRSQLQSEGRSRFARSTSTGALSPQAPSRPTPDATVQAIQRKLNELGYKAGAADGLMGRGTRSAIIAFQQDRGLAATGVADQALLLQLQRAPARSTGNWYANDPVVQEAPSQPAMTSPLPVPPPPSANRSARPANSWVSGSNWYCNDGYKKVGNSCEKLAVPRNAWVSGSNWYCNDGFRKVGDQCIALNVPDNAWVSGSNWYCNDGYRKVGDRCERLNVPRNAWVSGSNWYCNDGFRKVGDQCVALNVPDNAWVSGSNWYCNDGYRKVGDMDRPAFRRHLR